MGIKLSKQKTSYKTLNKSKQPFKVSWGQCLSWPQQDEIEESDYEDSVIDMKDGDYGDEDDVFH